MVQLKIEFSQGSDAAEIIELSRVPCVGEYLEFGDHAYEVGRVVHHINPKETVADIFVLGLRIGGKYASGATQIPPMKF